MYSLPAEDLLRVFFCTAAAPRRAQSEEIPSFVEEIPSFVEKALTSQ